MADTSKPTGAAPAVEAPKPVPGFRDQTVQAYTTVKDTVLDKEKRSSVYEQAKGAVSQGLAVTKETLDSAEGRQHLLDQTKAALSQVTSHLTDSEKRAALLKNTKDTVTYAAQGVKDPAVRQDIHDRAAALSHSALSSAGLVPGAPASGTATAAGTGAATGAATGVATGAPVTSSLPNPASTYAAAPMPTSGMAHTMPGPKEFEGPTQSEGPSVSGLVPSTGVPISGAQAAAAAPPAVLAGTAAHDQAGNVPHLKEQ